MPQIAHFIPYTGTAMGGPVNGMAAYVSLLADGGWSVAVYSSPCEADGKCISLDSRVRMVQAPASCRGGFRRSPDLWRQVQAADIGLVHSHGLWTDVHRLAGHLARIRKLPHLLAPCGMLMPGALRHRWWKKVPIRLWFQDRALREAQCLHAKSEKEYDDIRRFGLRNPIAIIANPIVRPVDQGLRDYGTAGLRDCGTISSAAKEKAESRKQKAEVGNGKAEIKAQPSLSSISHLPSPLSRGPWSVVPQRRTVLFLGRLHPVKGVGRLVEAWAEIQIKKAESIPLKSRNWESRKQKSAQMTEDGVRRSGDWQLVIAGPDEVGMRPGLEAALRAAGCGDSVVFTGQLDEGQKWAAYRAADLFVMPSDFENFGNSIVEAMLSGLPVITTTGTPWKELPVQGAGWCVEPTVEAVRDALGAAMALSDDARQEMGRRAAVLAAKFSPEQAGADLIQVYEWMLGTGPKPGCVVL